MDNVKGVIEMAGMWVENDVAREVFYRKGDFIWIGQSYESPQIC